MQCHVDIVSKKFKGLNEKITGAFQLLQLQEEMRKQFKGDGIGAQSVDVESQFRLNKDSLMSSLWKLNVVDIEVTLLHVCQLVYTFYRH